MSRKKNKNNDLKASDLLLPSNKDLVDAAVMHAVTHSRTARSLWLKFYVLPMSIVSGFILFPCIFAELNWDFSFHDVLVATGLFTWFMLWINDGGK